MGQQLAWDTPSRYQWRKDRREESPRGGPRAGSGGVRRQRSEPICLMHKSEIYANGANERGRAQHHRTEPAVQVGGVDVQFFPHANGICWGAPHRGTLASPRPSPRPRVRCSPRTPLVGEGEDLYDDEEETPGCPAPRAPSTSLTCSCWGRLRPSHSPRRSRTILPMPLQQPLFCTGTRRGWEGGP